jgi:hypothetical protein
MAPTTNVAVVNRGMIQRWRHCTNICYDPWIQLSVDTSENKISGIICGDVCMCIICVYLYVDYVDVSWVFVLCEVICGCDRGNEFYLARIYSYVSSFKVKIVDIKL